MTSSISWPKGMEGKIVWQVNMAGRVEGIKSKHSATLSNIKKMGNLGLKFWFLFSVSPFFFFVFFLNILTLWSKYFDLLGFHYAMVFISHNAFVCLFCVSHNSFSSLACFESTLFSGYEESRRLIFSPSWSLLLKLCLVPPMSKLFSFVLLSRGLLFQIFLFLCGYNCTA